MLSKMTGITNGQEFKEFCLKGGFGPFTQLLWFAREASCCQVKSASYRQLELATGKITGTNWNWFSRRPREKWIQVTSRLCLYLHRLLPAI